MTLSRRSWESTPWAFLCLFGPPPTLEKVLGVTRAAQPRAAERREPREGQQR
jgi:hypothetical protein